MVRTYKRKTARASYTKDTLLSVMNMVASGEISKRQAMLKFGVPRSTIAKRMKTPDVNPENLGRFKRVFSDDYEKELVDYATEMQNRFYGLSINDLRSLAFQLAERNNIDHPFDKHQKLAGIDWVQSFMKRNKMSLRSPEPTSLARVAGFNRVQVSRFFEILKNEYIKHSYTANQVYNLDESGITTVQCPSKVIARKGSKQVGRIVSAEKGVTTTIVCAMSAAGNFVPPMFIFKRKLMNDRLMKGAPAGATGAVSDNGWIDRNLFVKYLHHFVKHVNPSESNRVIIIFDGHASHKSLEAVEFAKEHNITLITLPPHTSHKLQPLDVAFFGPLKTNYNRAIDNWMTTHHGQRVTAYDVAEIFGPAYLKTACAEKAVSGFSATGIFPYNADIFSDTDFAPSAVTEQPLHVTEQSDATTGDEVNHYRSRLVQSGQKRHCIIPAPATSLPKKSRHACPLQSVQKGSDIQPVPSTSAKSRGAGSSQPARKGSDIQPVPSTSAKSRGAGRDVSLSLDQMLL